jgi:flagellar protein FliO/FliZ
MQIKVLSQHHLGPKKSLAIIHVAGESMLVGITDNNISMIKSLSLIDDEVPADMPNTFGQTMAKKANEAQPMIDDLDEEFSFAGVTDTVSKKIKSMRSFS